MDKHENGKDLKKSRRKPKKNISQLENNPNDNINESMKNLQIQVEESLEKGRRHLDKFNFNNKEKAKEVEGNSIVSLTEGSKQLFNKNRKKKRQKEEHMPSPIHNQNPSQISNESSLNNIRYDESMISMNLSKPNHSMKERDSKEMELKLKLIVLRDKYKHLKKLTNFKVSNMKVDENTRELFSCVKKAISQQKFFLKKMNKLKNKPNASDSQEERQIKEYFAEDIKLEAELDEMINLHSKGPLGKEGESDDVRIENKKESKCVENEVNNFVDINAYESNEYSLFSPENHPNSNGIDPIKPQVPLVTQGGDVKDVKDLTQITEQEISKLPEESKECFICLIDFMTDNSATFLPCLHIFHSACIKDWFKKDPSCPICKHKIEGETSDKALEP